MTGTKKAAGLVLAALLLPVWVGAQRASNGASTQDEAPPSGRMAEAEQLAGRGRLEAALALLDKLATEEPESPGVERLRGLIFYQREEFAAAIAAFAKAEAQDPGDRVALEMHGVSLFRSGAVKEAVPLLEKGRAPVESANIDPDYVLGLCYADLGRYDDARRAFAAQFGFAPESAAAYLLAGRLFLRRGLQEMREEAHRAASRALELEPALPLAHELLGEVALAHGDAAGAVREFEAERALNPMSPELYDRLGDAYLRSGQYKEAQGALNRAVLLEPNATGPYILLGATLLKLGQPIQALHYLDHAEKMDPNNYMTHNYLGQAYKATGQVEPANREFRRSVDLQHGGATGPTEK